MVKTSIYCDHCGKKIDRDDDQCMEKGNSIFDFRYDLCENCREIFEDEENKYHIARRVFECWGYSFFNKKAELESRDEYRQRERTNDAFLGTNAVQPIEYQQPNHRLGNITTDTVARQPNQ